MNIATIEDYVNQKNRWNELCKSRLLSLLSKEDRQRIANSIDADLSPENLTCDGELSAKEVDQRYRYLIRAQQELLSIDPELEFYEY